jgi:hypothetical protein
MSKTDECSTVDSRGYIQLCVDTTKSISYSIQCSVVYESSPYWMMAPNIYMLQKVSYKKSVITEI